MFLIPAVDILDGKCVRLKKGDFQDVTCYGDDVCSVAKDFQNQGAGQLHLVDLDGAKSGKLINVDAISHVLSKVKIPVQVGGGIRSFSDAEKLFSFGVRQIVLGTSVVLDRGFVQDLVSKFGFESILIALDFRNGKLAVSGWCETSDSDIDEVLFFLKSINLIRIIVTDISRDGMLQGANFLLFKKFVDAGFEVIASGGISSLSDLLELKKIGVYAAIVGKALYENKFSISQANALLEGENFLTKRIISCLDVKDGRVVKGVNFKDLKDCGDPVSFGKMYSDAGADELVFLDISATSEGRKTFVKTVRAIAEAISIPFTVGGGVSSVLDIKKLLKAGADKVSIGTQAVRNPDFVRAAAEYFGSQCIVVSIDAKRVGESWKVCVKSGAEMTDLDVIDFAKKMEIFGAGELLVNSLDRDGEKKGFDMELLRAVSFAVRIPVIASSGAGEAKDFLKVFREADVQAALAASVFHTGECTVRSVKEYLKKNSINVRL